MLFASTSLSLVRELGGEKFRESIFATTKQELSVEGFKKHDAHGKLDAPLTEEEETLQKVKAAELKETRGTSARSSHISGGVQFPMTDEATTALKGLPEGGDNLVQLVS
jgi:twinfilin-like protein